MIKFQHFMFVPNPPFQRSAIFELGPKGDFSPSPPALPLLSCLSARAPTTQARGKPCTHHSAGISLSLSYYWCSFYHCCLYNNFTVEPRLWFGTAQTLRLSPVGIPNLWFPLSCQGGEDQKWKNEKSDRTARDRSWLSTCQPQTVLVCNSDLRLSLSLFLFL